MHPISGVHPTPERIEKMPDVARGVFHAFFVYDVADTINLAELLNRSGKSNEKMELELHVATPPGRCFQFISAPLESNLKRVDAQGLDGHVRVKIYDYGTVALRASFPVEGSFEQVLSQTASLRQSESLADCMNRTLNETLESISAALNQQHSPLMETYFAVEINELAEPVSALQLMQKQGVELACLLQAENRALTPIEQEDALRSRFSYFENDLVLFNSDCALIFESRENAEIVESILEFAITQLVELRTYDRRLDNELDEIYKWDLAATQHHWLFGRRATKERMARSRKLLVDIRELSDRSSNALKILGDGYYVRLYKSIASRLGLSDWQKQLESKLLTVQEIYRFATDQAQHARSDFLELVIILLIIVEILLSLTARGH